MATRKSPLRDRLLSNSPDPIKSSILRESGMGWNSSSSATLPSSGSTGSIISPLRIAKRDSPRQNGPIIARRTSSSYRHVHNNNLVTKSPFKSQIPTPSTPSSRTVFTVFPTRRVSGEKRPRPSSMHEQAESENERPFALKRERRQSKTFQGLIEKEPVTKSPFKLQQRTPSSETKPPPTASFMYNDPFQRSLTPPPKLQPPHTSSGGPSPSPARSALVSRRLHGPRLSGGSRRERRKTVTFHERCDVLEFDREEETDEEDVLQNHSEDDEHDDFYQGMHEEDNPFHGSLPPNHDLEEVMADDTSYESIQLSDQGIKSSVPSLLSDPDASITGIVDEMFFSSNAANLLSDTSLLSNMSTPPRHLDIPTDLETEDGIPFGRSHHVERFLQHHENELPQQSPHILQPHFSLHASPLHHNPSRQQSPSNYPFNLNLPTSASPHGPPATPPRRSPGTRHSTPPLGRSTHLERVRKAREEEREVEVDGDDIDKLPASPSPMKKMTGAIGLHDETLIPKFDLNTGNCSESNNSANISVDPFAPRLQDESILSDIQSHCVPTANDESMDFAKFSVESSQVNLSGLEAELHSSDEALNGQQASLCIESTPPPPREIGHVSPTVAENHAAFSRHISSPVRSASPMFVASSSRERISREEVQQRLLNQRGQSPAFDEVVRPSSPSIKPPTCEITVEEAIDENNEKLDRQSSQDKERDRMSVLTTQTDFSTETAIVENVERCTMGLMTLAGPGKVSDQDFGMLGPAQFDFGSKFSLGGLGISTSDAPISVGSLDNPNLRVANPQMSRPASIESASVRLGNVDVDMDMKSALDRLMDDVAGAGARADDSMMTEECDDSYDQSLSHHDDSSMGFSRPRIMERAATDSALLQENEANGIISRNVSGASTITLPPPPVPAKDNIRQREQIILEKRREARRLEEDDMDVFDSNRRHQRHLGVGRPSRRRSMSTGDAETMGGGAKKRGDVLLEKVGLDDPLGDSIERELQKLVEPPKKSKYQVREHETTIYASSSDERVSHMSGPGDVAAGRAWRTVRRPSDMNEYAKQIKEYRAQEKGKAYGKVFVKVLGVRGLNLPLPQQPTVMTCTLNNGIHFVTTPEGQLANDCRIDQEFELIEHSKLEFTLTLKIRRDPHIMTQFKALTPPPVANAAPVPPPVIQAAPKSSGMRSFFSSSPKKSSKEKIAARPQPQLQPQAVHRLPENLARHLKPDGTLARAFISFKDISSRCDMRLFETSSPLIGQQMEIGGKFSTQECGEIILQVFRLPPLPGIPQEQLPQSLEECHRGLRYINWHKVTYFQGTLTQNGGDCRSWRRRQLRVIGSNLVAFNDVTKKATATIDLKKAVAVEDDQEPRNSVLSPSTGLAAQASRNADEYDGLYGVERSFRLIFPHEQEIIFFADTDEEKSKWLEVLRALVGHIPPHPLWAELLWQRQEEISRHMTAVQQQAPQSSFQPSSRRPPQ